MLQISRLDRKINNKISEITQYRELVYSLQGIDNKERVQTTLKSDKIGTAIAKLDEMERKLDKLIDEYVDKKNYIIWQIESIENELYYQILFSRYIEKKTFELISTEIHYSYKQTRRLHTKSLQDFEKKYGKEYKMS